MAREIDLYDCCKLTTKIGAVLAVGLLDPFSAERAYGVRGGFWRVYTVGKWGDLLPGRERRYIV